MGLPVIRKASAVPMTTKRSNRAPSDRVGIPGLVAGLKAAPVGNVPTGIGLPTTLLVAVAITETVLEV